MDSISPALDRSCIALRNCLTADNQAKTSVHTVTVEVHVSKMFCGSALISIVNSFLLWQPAFTFHLNIYACSFLFGKSSHTHTVRSYNITKIRKSRQNSHHHSGQKRDESLATLRTVNQLAYAVTLGQTDLI